METFPTQVPQFPIASGPVWHQPLTFSYCHVLFTSLSLRIPLPYVLSSSSSCPHSVPHTLCSSHLPLSFPPTLTLYLPPPLSPCLPPYISYLTAISPSLSHSASNSPSLCLPYVSLLYLSPSYSLSVYPTRHLLPTPATSLPFHSVSFTSASFTSITVFTTNTTDD